MPIKRGLRMSEKLSKAPPVDDTKTNLELLKLRVEIVKLGAEIANECFAITVRIARVCIFLYFALFHIVARV